MIARRRRSNSVFATELELSMSSDEEYVEEVRLVWRRKDTYRSNSSASDEFERDLLRNKTTRGMAGPTESRAIGEQELRQRFPGEPIFPTADATSAPVPRQELSPEVQAIIDAVVRNIMDRAERALRERAYPYVRNVAYPAAKRFARELLRHGHSRPAPHTEPTARPVKTPPIDAASKGAGESEASTDEVDSAEPSIPMSRSDLTLIQLDLELAEDYIAHLRWLIAHADTTDDDLSPELDLLTMLVLEGRGGELDNEERQAVAAVIRKRGGAATARTSYP